MWILPFFIPPMLHINQYPLCTKWLYLLVSCSLRNSQVLCLLQILYPGETFQLWVKEFFFKSLLCFKISMFFKEEIKYSGSMLYQHFLKCILVRILIEVCQIKNYSPYSIKCLSKVVVPVSANTSIHSYLMII